jgi:hypothetical protein
MTHMTEAGRMQASGRCALQWDRTVPDGDGLSAVAGILIARTFALRGKCGDPDSNAAEDRAFPRGNDS